MNEAIRRLRSEAHQLARGKVPEAIRYPAPSAPRPSRSRGPSWTRGRPCSAWPARWGCRPRASLRWLEQSARPGLRPVTMRPEPAPPAPPAAGPVLITPQGVRVEGLDRDALIAVLRALG